MILTKISKSSQGKIYTADFSWVHRDGVQTLEEVEDTKPKASHPSLWTQGELAPSSHAPRDPLMERSRRREVLS